MRRWKLKAALCLVVGLVISVAIAWAGAMLEPQPGTYLWSPMVSRDVGERGDSPRPIERFGIHDGDMVTWTLEGNRITASGWALSREQFVLFPGTPPGKAVIAIGGLSIQYFEVYGAGWPLTALEWSDCEMMRMFNGSPPVSGVEAAWEFGLEYRPGFTADGWRRLPIRPWFYGAGLAVNTLVWGAAVCLVAMAPGVVRRRRRRARGLCVKCGYSLGQPGGAVLQQCPECGAATKPPAALDTGSPA